MDWSEWLNDDAKIQRLSEDFQFDEEQRSLSSFTTWYGKYE
jgi:hypothetical protein